MEAAVLLYSTLILASIYAESWVAMLDLRNSTISIVYFIFDNKWLFVEP